MSTRCSQNIWRLFLLHTSVARLYTRVMHFSESVCCVVSRRQLQDVCDKGRVCSLTLRERHQCCVKLRISAMETPEIFWQAYNNEPDEVFWLKRSRRRASPTILTHNVVSFFIFLGLVLVRAFQKTLSLTENLMFALFSGLRSRVKTANAHLHDVSCNVLCFIWHMCTFL